MNQFSDTTHKHQFSQHNHKVEISTEETLSFTSIDLNSDLPLYWFEERIQQIENGASLDELNFPKSDLDSSWHKFVATHELTAEEKVVLLLALAANFSPNH